jgi:Zn-dependent M28 family amino/carboxypeptidase
LANPAADGQLALTHVEKLSTDIGPRVAGTPQEVEARDYLAAILRQYGYTVTIQPFEYDASIFKPATVEVGGKFVTAVAIRDSTAGTASGPVVSGGEGRPEDFTPAIAGAIALINRGGFPISDKAQNAFDAGAVGVLVVNNEPGALIAGMQDEVPIPVVGIAQAEGAAIAERLQTEKLTANISVTDTTATSHNVVAKPPGTTTCDTVTGGHYDSVAAAPGADDNASGSAATLETARVVSARKLPGTHCFVLFGAEEPGLVGSRAFVDAMTDAELNGLRGMVNLDVVGLPQELELIGSPDFVSQAGLIADEMGLPWRPSEVPGGLGSDHAPFIAAGVPAVFLYRHDELFHTPQDTFDRMSPVSLAQTVEVASAFLAELVPGP